MHDLQQRPDHALDDSAAATETIAPATQASATQEALDAPLGMSDSQRTAADFVGPVQLKQSGPVAAPDDVRQAAAMGTQSPAAPLPYAGAIQRAFGQHDVGNVQAHLGAEASQASGAMGAQAFAVGNHVAFAGTPSLHTAAHEAAHVIQQRGGVHLKSDVGESGDVYEQHADAVADAVVAGKSAETLLSDEP